MGGSDPIASVSLLCDVEGIRIDNPDASGWTPLALAARQGAVMSSLCLLNHGANIDAADKLVRAPPTAANSLYIAQHESLTPAVWIVSTQGNTPLVQALVASHVTYGALLMQKGASLNTKVTTAVTKHKWSALCRLLPSLTAACWNGTNLTGQFRRSERCRPSRSSSRPLCSTLPLCVTMRYASFAVSYVVPLWVRCS
jgi:ankyrin repeat protein